ncbi:hypothetical protein B0E43_12960 [Algoriphagus sp. A40]|nr:hypothetical protein B0E43_12960 [Algoriphagus sp. A40]
MRNAVKNYLKATRKSGSFAPQTIQKKRKPNVLEANAFSTGKYRRPPSDDISELNDDLEFDLLALGFSFPKFYFKNLSF